MTNQSPFSRRPSTQPTVPRGETLGTYDSYVDAQKVVDRLSKADFDVKQVSIVGNDLKTVERVTGKLTYAKAAAAGAASGLWFGLFIGLVFFIFSPVPNFSFVIGALLIGAAFGMLFAIATYSLNRRRRDFTSTHQVLASSYQIVVAPGLISAAQDVLSRPEPEKG
ncbi:MAG TPA: general stress protein [Glaciihabitans sp.]|nr:general stress protein [Glaciihabitans sp.]